MFFDTFKSLCQEKGISCSRAASEIGLSNSITTKWKKTGATPDGSTLAKIAAYFDVSMGYLLGAEQEKAPTSSGERQISDDELKFALWGDCDDIDEEDLADVRSYAAFVRERKKRK